MSVIRTLKEQRKQVQKRKQEIRSLLQDMGEKITDLEADGIEVRPLQAENLKDLRVAAIMDEFTLACFAPECQLTQLTPENWLAEMESADPELLFIESAWQGKDRKWYGKINRCAPEVRALIAYAHEHHTPVVFWCKEDPVHTETFMVIARFADIVFTTDAECIAKYKRELGHSRVYHLHFGAQPRVHNPIEKYERKDKFCFAGSYYHRYEDRCRVFDAFADVFAEGRGLDIYDRNYGEPGPMTAFPKKYAPMILGKLEPEDIDVAYKGYRFGLNMSSVTQSQTMFARRVFELMASNTLVVSNFCRGIKNYFGDLVICTDDAASLKAALEQRCQNPIMEDKLRLAALRAVLREHLCEDRLDEVVERVFGKSIKRQLPTIVVCSHVHTQQEADRVAKMFADQSYQKKHLVFFADDASIHADGATVLLATALLPAVQEVLNSAEYLSYFQPEDWYGENYLLDFALSARYGDFDGMGKGGYFAAVDGEAQRQQADKAYHFVDELPARRSMIRCSLLEASVVPSLAGGTVFRGGRMLSVDTFNYCENWPEAVCPAAADMVIADQGLTMDEIRHVVDHIEVGAAYEADAYEIAAARSATAQAEVTTTVVNGTVVIDSHLQEKQHVYFYLPERLPVQEVSDAAGRFTLQCLWHGELSILCGCTFYDDGGEKLDACSAHGRMGTFQVPKGAASLQLFYRVKGTGTGTLRRILLCPGMKAGNDFLLDRSKTLLLTNFYPASDDLYRHVFVHKRVLAYKESGTNLDVMLLRSRQELASFREFGGINIVTGSRALLASALERGAYPTICVHCMDRAMWETLKPYLGTRRLLIWCHGSDIQPWQRRAYNYKTEAEQEKAEAKSDERMKLWREIFAASEKQDIHFIFVSEHFAQEVLGDYGYAMERSRYSVIHNFIDGEFFAYHPKTADDRLRLLTIKSFDDEKYANDITTKAIVALSKRPCFAHLTFSIYGHGKDFDAINAPLREFPNVELHERFLTQQEIAALHRAHGAYIGTTRMDTQGVSRDEAMASGLVPVANAVAAVPEFVDENCGLLVPGEDAEAVADAIERLYQEPELFLKLSKNAAARVRRQSGRKETIERELALIRGEQV